MSGADFFKKTLKLFDDDLKHVNHKKRSLMESKRKDKLACTKCGELCESDEHKKSKCCGAKCRPHEIKKEELKEGVEVDALRSAIRKIVVDFFNSGEEQTTKTKSLLLQRLLRSTEHLFDDTFKEVLIQNQRSKHSGSSTGTTNESWDVEDAVNPSKKGMFAGKTLSELKKEYNELKRSGPHEKGSADYTKMKELQFAIRSKTGWGKV